MFGKKNFSEKISVYKNDREKQLHSEFVNTFYMLCCVFEYQIPVKLYFTLLFSYLNLFSKISQQNTTTTKPQNKF
jgi:hypothetical protein